MDDIQFWIYLIFAAIYVISRALRKKAPEQEDTATEEQPRPTRRPPKSFEELLREFTEAGAEDEEPTPPVQQQQSAPRSRPERPAEVPSRRDRSFEQEGQTRHFADDESRKIYEESIRQAEQSSVTYERDEHFKIARVDDNGGGGTEANEVAKEIREILSSPQSARKAVILSEIFNRKY